jgi:hypothetical protein
MLSSQGKVAEACFSYEFQKGQKRKRKVTPSKTARSGEASAEPESKVCLLLLEFYL